MKMNEKSLNSSYQANYNPKVSSAPRNQRSKPGIIPPLPISIGYHSNSIDSSLLLRSSDHSSRSDVAGRRGARLASNDLLLDLDQRAAGAAGREQDIGDEITLDVVLLAGFETLEELETGQN